MELNWQTKSMWAAQYYGQKVKVHKAYKEPQMLWNPSAMKDCHLELISLKDITEEDTWRVAQCYFGYELKGYSIESAIATMQKIIENFRLGKNILLYTAYQHLQSRGYALPWNGIAVIQMEMHGWLKYKQF